MINATILTSGFLLLMSATGLCGNQPDPNSGIYWGVHVSVSLKEDPLGHKHSDYDTDTNLSALKHLLDNGVEFKDNKVKCSFKFEGQFSGKERIDGLKAFKKAGLLKGPISKESVYEESITMKCLVNGTWVFPKAVSCEKQKSMVNFPDSNSTWFGHSGSATDMPDNGIDIQCNYRGK